MWLLRTDRAELKFFVCPEVVPAPGFAILSHVWGDDEQTFQETEALRVRCSTTGANPRDLASEKIRKACELAQQHGYEWLWVDTCCIDKTSSAELSEAINSMFHYYALATVCYAFLRDVPLSEDDDIADLFDNRKSDDFAAFGHKRRWSQKSGLTRAFTCSRWHRRGWTLQELIAPRNVLFLSQSWNVFGSKADFAPFLEHITGISEELFRMEKRCVDFSVAQRMSWAAKRVTTRIEDEAYCLLGIFSINMPTLYGEGRNAFRRLQQEIMKQSPDTSLFVWKLSDIWLYERNTSESLTSTKSFLASSPAAFDLPCREVQFKPDAYETSAKRTKRSRLAHAPLAVEQAAFLLRGSQPDKSSRYRSRKMTTFSITPHGIIANIMVVRVEQHGKSVKVLWELGCFTECFPGSHEKLFLELVPSHGPASGVAEQLYSRGRIYKESEYSRHFHSPSTRWSWEEVLIISP